jgi:hypothetical protein
MGGPWQWLVFLAAGGLGLVLLAVALAVVVAALTTQAAWRGRVAHEVELRHLHAVAVLASSET